MTQKLQHRKNVLRQVWLLLGLLALFCIGLAWARTAISGSFRYVFLIWNLFLGFLPLLFATLYYGKPQQASWVTKGYLAAWFLFLPNSFYLLTDFIHLQQSVYIPLLFDIVLLFVYSVTGLLVGLVSLALIESGVSPLLRGWRRPGFIAMVLAASSFAIYLGRFLRWNSWDVITNPFGLLFDISNTVADPISTPHVLPTTVLFWAMLGIFYAASVWAVSVIQSLSDKQQR